EGGGAAGGRGPSGRWGAGGGGGGPPPARPRRPRGSRPGRSPRGPLPAPRARTGPRAGARRGAGAAGATSLWPSIAAVPLAIRPSAAAAEFRYALRESSGPLGGGVQLQVPAPALGVAGLLAGTAGLGARPRRGPRP